MSEHQKKPQQRPSRGKRGSFPKPSKRLPSPRATYIPKQEQRQIASGQRSRAEILASYTPFGRFLDERRRAKGVSAEALIVFMNLPPSRRAYWSILTGQGIALPEHLVFAAQLLDINPIELFLMYRQQVDSPEQINWDDPTLDAITFRLLCEMVLPMPPDAIKRVFDYVQMVWGQLPEEERGRPPSLSGAGNQLNRREYLNPVLAPPAYIGTQERIRTGTYRGVHALIIEPFKSEVDRIYQALEDEVVHKVIFPGLPAPDEVRAAVEQRLKEYEAHYSRYYEQNEQED